MRRKMTLFVFFVMIAFFISCLVEKFLYPNISFDIVRGLLVFISMLLFLSFVFGILTKRQRRKIYSFIDDFLSFDFLSFFKNTFIVKICYSIVITLYVSIFLKNIYYFIFGVCEICLISFLSNLIVVKKKKLGYFTNSLLMLLYNINVIVLIFGGTFVSLIMLTNLNSIEDLQGNAFIYIVAVILTLIFSLIPIKEINISKKRNKVYLIESLLYEVFLIVVLGISFSPICNYGVLLNDGFSYWKLQRYISNTVYKDNIFYNKNVEDHIKYDGSVTKHPNVIIIFTEGLSKHIIFDYRNLMPNVKKFSSESIDFTAYYNHTAATYRGLIGQLYSGYQMDNLDENHLVSLQSVLSLHGYNTFFLNTEPKNPEFTNYLKSMEFDELVTSNVTKGVADSISDKDTYDLLFKTAVELNKKSKPFLLGVYSFGTHVSCDSTDKKFGNGNDNVLNRFYDLDYHFGLFMDNFNKSELFDNTIVIFTTDHASYTDYDYLRAFNNVYEREYSFLDEIPLFIYHKGVDPKKIDVNGRNSLDFAPTVLDYIDISSPNYFLGQSLFSKDSDSKFDTVFTEGVRYLSSKNEELEQIDFENEIVYQINGYLSLAKKK